MEFLVAGVLVVVFGWHVYRFAYLHWRGIRTTGTIIELVEDKSDEGGTFTPVVSFTTSQGTQIIAKSSFGMMETGTFFRIGERVEITYSLKNPQHFVIAGYEVSLLLIWGLLAVGALGYCYYHRVG